VTSNAVLLAEAERVLRDKPASTFNTDLFASPQAIELVRAVEDQDAWKAGYPSLDAFYTAWEPTHPGIRVYAAVRREIETSDPLTSPGGTIPQMIERHLREQSS
jgi:hypothetical protein